MGTMIWTATADFPGSTRPLPHDDEPILYSSTAPEDAVTALDAKLASGEIQLTYDPEWGYLPSLLEAFGIPKSSQTLVFSKTSLHRRLISTNSPRAIYFTDDVYVGWVRNAPVLEISSADPKNGGQFYSLPQNPNEIPRFKRELACLECHVSSKSLGVPGHLVRSFLNQPDGWPDNLTGTPRISHNTPFEERWGGWYITGTLDAVVGTRANLPTTELAELRATDPTHQANIQDLSQFIHPEGYLEPGADMVAMLVLEHQSHMHNFITRMNYEARIFHSQYGHLRYMEKIIDYFVRYLLFVDEQPLPGQVTGTSTFAADFEKLGPKDSLGRSLRDLDLQTRLFKHPCSFLIYSPAFEKMFPPLKERVLEKLLAILKNENRQPPFDALPPGRNTILLDILRETLPDLPDSWKTSTESGG